MEVTSSSLACSEVHAQQAVSVLMVGLSLSSGIVAEAWSAKATRAAR
jgi:hypothetical protein